MKLTFFCGSGSCPCPNVYETDRGTFVIQGDLVADSDVVLSEKEGLVEVPAWLVAELVSKAQS